MFLLYKVHASGRKSIWRVVAYRLRWAREFIYLVRRGEMQMAANRMPTQRAEILPQIKRETSYANIGIEVTAVGKQLQAFVHTHDKITVKRNMQGHWAHKTIKNFELI